MQSVSENDRILLRILRDSGSLSVLQLCERLEVTATAVRQKLERLGAGGLIQRIEVRQGVGRPSFQYAISTNGLRSLGTNQSELANVVWDELLKIEDDEIRQQLLARISARLASRFTQPSAEFDKSTLEFRLETVAKQLRDQNMPVSMVTDEELGLPVLRFTGCPYPDLSEKSHDICEMETRMLGEMAGHPMRLAECKCHTTDGSCTYVPVTK